MALLPSDEDPGEYAISGSVPSGQFTKNRWSTGPVGAAGLPIIGTSVGSGTISTAYGSGVMYTPTYPSSYATMASTPGPTQAAFDDEVKRRKKANRKLKAAELRNETLCEWLDDYRARTEDLMAENLKLIEELVSIRKMRDEQDLDEESLLDLDDLSPF
jgi:hypothetical protein